MEESKDSHEDEQGETSADPSSPSCPLQLRFKELPYHLQHCLMYCSIFPESYLLSKAALIRLLVAQGLIQEKAGRIMEDVAEEYVCELINQRLLRVKDKYNRSRGTQLRVPCQLQKFCVNQLMEGKFAAFKVFICSDISQLKSQMNNLQVTGLFLLAHEDLSQNDGSWLQFDDVSTLRVLELKDSKIKKLPAEVGDLVNLRYLGLKSTDINELPGGLGRLQALQTLDIRWCRDLTGLSDEILKLVRLRHLKMFKTSGVCGMKLPAGIGRLTDLLTLTGIYAGGGIAAELGNLTGLRRLGVMDVDEESITELFDSIMKMAGLLSLSLEAKYSYPGRKLVILESFSPPPFLRKLRLEGILEKLPAWFGSLDRLTRLRLGSSHLCENPSMVLQALPNLQSLTLWEAYDVKQMGKEFCSAGGFLKLEILIIASGVLEEWTELEEGALPSLKYLHLHSCMRLKMLPEGLQSLSTLEQLHLLPLLDDHAGRLKPDGGEEYYKIKHIPEISYITNSMVQEYVTTGKGGIEMLQG
ncbi:disease resistance protein RPM1-like [Argentina anserina]|uniref:disease resistance protein RPM1-like n=1 Tax=Argentina anserina TaxID=57926 RepID=UPI0021761EEA|nr:disease resistance protein RPM1-like [Potentilla anserina]